jgi:integrase
LALVKKCRHGRGLRSRRAKLKAWRECGCSWLGDVYVDGRRRYVNLGALPYERARVEHAQLVADQVAGRIRPRGASLAELVDRWVDAKEIAPDARPNSIHVYRSRAKHIAAYFGDAPAAGIRVEDVRAFVEDLAASGRSPATVGSVYALLAAVLRSAADEGAIDTAPLPSRRPALAAGQVERDARLSIAQARQVIDALREPVASLAEVALLTGCRVGELLALEPADLDGERLRITKNADRYGTVGPPKTKAGRRLVPLTPRALELVRGRVEVADGGRLWPIDYKRALRELHAALEECDLARPGLGWHALRHCHTALLDAAGLSLRDAGARLGHGPATSQTLRYGWAAETGEAAAIDEALRRHAPP